MFNYEEEQFECICYVNNWLKTVAEYLNQVHNSYLFLGTVYMRSSHPLPPYIYLSLLFLVRVPYLIRRTLPLLLIPDEALGQYLALGQELRGLEVVVDQARDAAVRHRDRRAAVVVKHETLGRFVATTTAAAAARDRARDYRGWRRGHVDGRRLRGRRGLRRPHEMSRLRVVLAARVAGSRGRRRRGHRRRRRAEPRVLQRR